MSDRAAVLWIHAFPLSSALWRPQVEGLPAYAHVAPDLPGLGASDPNVAPYSMDDAARAMAAALEAQGVKRCVGVGMSMGGYVLLALLRLRPELVGAAIFCSTRATEDTPEGRAGREKFAVAVMKEGSAFAAREMLPKLLAPSAPPAVKKEIEGIVLRNAPEGIAAAQRAMAARPDSRALLPTLRIPALAVAGALDELIPPAQTQAIADAIPGARYVAIPGAGHLPNVEKPAEFNAAVGEFLGKHAPR